MSTRDEMFAESAALMQRLSELASTGSVDHLERTLKECPYFEDYGEAVSSILNRAIEIGDLDMVRAMTTLGACVNPPCQAFPPLRTAVLARDCAMIELLSKLGADLNVRMFNDETALHIAASNGDVAVVNLLLRLGADPGLQTRIEPYFTPLMQAASCGYEEVVSTLLRYGADATHVNNWGQTAYSVAKPTCQHLLNE